VNGSNAKAAVQHWQVTATPTMGRKQPSGHRPVTRIKVNEFV